MRLREEKNVGRRSLTPARQAASLTVVAHKAFSVRRVAGTVETTASVKRYEIRVSMRANPRSQYPDDPRYRD